MNIGLTASLLERQSLISQKSKLLTDRFLKNTRFIDVSYDGDIEKISLEYGTAIKNAVMMWLFSSKGDYINRPGFGGILDDFMGKELSTNNASILETIISSGFEDSFSRYLRLEFIQVEADFKQRLWVISMVIEDLINRRFEILKAGIEV